MFYYLQVNNLLKLKAKNLVTMLDIILNKFKVINKGVTAKSFDVQHNTTWINCITNFDYVFAEVQPEPCRHLGWRALEHSYRLLTFKQLTFKSCLLLFKSSPSYMSAGILYTSSIIRQKGEYKKGCNKKTKHAKSPNRPFALYRRLAESWLRF